MNRTRGMSLRARFSAGAAGAAMTAALLTGCANGEPEVSSEAAAALQDGVMSVSTAAAAGDYAGAQTSLEAVKTTLAETSAAKQVSTERATEIQAAIDLVAADLAGAIAGTPAEPAPVEPAPTEPSESPTPTETPTPSPSSSENEKDSEDSEKSDDPKESESPDPVVSEVPADDDKGNGECKKKDDDCE